ncbi:MAG: polysaccharide deacetylase family protein [Gemmatimonadetes bacterium]|nr:polysaccharide deacetylase family protein [Gemmatimonadota bacterium]MDA1104625.1 polysaccharide deacetylase family protein [Gemmatimonadota bacterium]
MGKLFCFRFDVDTHCCVHEGMPALVGLGNRLDVPFTFFVNMGRAVSRRAFLRERVSSPVSPSRPQAAKLSALTKLGWGGYLKAAALNPIVGGAATGLVRAAHESGHEIGLHGGRNHAVWQLEASDWGAARVAAEIDAVLPTLSRALGDTCPQGFASPGWTSTPALDEVLAPRGFRYVADLHGPEPGSGKSGPTHDAERPDPPAALALPRVRTQLTGEPGGVAYLEHLRARGFADADILRRFESDLDGGARAMVVYDHPYHAGLRELTVIARMVGIVRSAGFEVVPLHEVARDGVT